MPNIVVQLENKLSRSASAGPIMGPTSVSSVWWPNHQNWGRTRDLAELDHHSKYDRNDSLHSFKCTDDRFRSVSSKDRSSTQKFAPGKDDIEDKKIFDECWMGQIFKSVPSWAASPCRPTHFHDYMNWKLDKYKLTARPEYSLTTNDRTKKQSFDLSRSDRFLYPKQFSKDFSRSGGSLNRWSTVHEWKNPDAKGATGPRPVKRPPRWA
mmetsp:Transcript_1423/g.3193  ORF Transcript_1423/g.3193 Transcript_1423/m.3193 type:complete len:209 (+) Transcript_1423:113-739(+)